MDYEILAEEMVKECLMNVQYISDLLKVEPNEQKRILLKHNLKQAKFKLRKANQQLEYAKDLKEW